MARSVLPRPWLRGSPTASRRCVSFSVPSALSVLPGACVLDGGPWGRRLRPQEGAGFPPWLRPGNGPLQDAGGVSLPAAPVPGAAQSRDPRPRPSSLTSLP